MRITIQTKPDIDLRDLHDFVRGYGASLTSAGLRNFFLVDIENPETGELVLSLLQRKAGVEAAYVKPAEEMP